MTTQDDVADLYDKAKWGSLLGLGYLAYLNPKATASVVWRISERMIVNNLKDTAFALKVIYQELIKPEVLTPGAAVARSQWANLIQRGPIFGTTIFLTTGGALAWVFAEAAETVWPNHPLEHPDQYGALPR